MLTRNNIYFTVAVAALGFFVDVYDIQIFNIVSVDSLKGIGITNPVEIDTWNAQLFLWQMGGMLLGGILWGIYGDKKGRRSVLFGSILLYSLANIANGFITNIPQYEILRLLAGLGLAGELGAAVTLVSEIMPKENRGMGTVVIVGLGVMGIIAAVTVKTLFTWQTCYFVGGGLGLALLLLRFQTFESGMFEEMDKSNIPKGAFKSLFTNKERFIKYLCCIMLGFPIWYALGILIKFSPKFGEVMHITEGKVNVSNAIMYAYIGLSCGDFLSGWLSQYFKNRKKIVLGYIIALSVMTLIFLFIRNITLTQFYTLCFITGASCGYWALFVTIASEQFGTNIRATVTTTVPNFVRGAVIPITFAFQSLGANVTGALTVGVVCVALALISIFTLKETFGKDLNYMESTLL